MVTIVLVVRVAMSPWKVDYKTDKAEDEAAQQDIALIKPVRVKHIVLVNHCLSIHQSST